MITVSDTLVFALQNAHISHVFRVDEAGALEHIHHGPPVRAPHDLAPPLRVDRESGALAPTLHMGRDRLNRNALPAEYPVRGTSDYRSPALAARMATGGEVLDLRYTHHTLSAERPDLGPLPRARGDGSQTLNIHLADSPSGVEAVLHYTIWDDHPVLARSATITNTGEGAVTLLRALSAALDLSPGAYDAVHLHGSWSREMSVERTPVPQGEFRISSARGNSSAAHAPFLAVLERDATETSGRVFASTLLYSGNHTFSAETGEFGDVRLLCGLNPDGFCWRLEPGGTFHTPEALQLFTGGGLRAMSHAWHDFIRAHVLPARFRQAPRPTYLNTWEAAYFDVSEAKVLQLADTAVELGVDMLVLDDGWFRGRRDDTTSLGDWTADAERFPGGLPTLAKRVVAKGLRFGLWVEPEMVSPDSDLYRAHPDWILHQLGRTPSTGRNQLVLDLSRADVRDHLFATLCDLLDGGDITYVKWDMNRSMTEVGSSALSPNRQAEVSHRYMLGLYTLLARLTQRFPDILFENCAAGGARFDLGMLSFMAQSWTSDMSDPVGRRDIVAGASLFLPLDCMAAYVGPSPNHQTGRAAPLRTRFLAGALCAAQGVSLNADDIRDTLPKLQRYMAWSRATANVRLGARFTRLVHTPNASCWQMTSADGAEIWVLDLHILSAPNHPVRRARLHGLDPGATYRLRDDAHGLGDDGRVIG